MWRDCSCGCRVSDTSACVVQMAEFCRRDVVMSVSSFRPLILLAPGLAVYLLASGVLTAEAQTAAPLPSSRVAAAARAEPRPESRSDAPELIEAFTEPYREISLAAGEMGTLASLSVREGDAVAAGTVLATLDDRVLRAALEVARQSMQAEGPLKSAEADVRLKQNELEKLLTLRDRSHASQREVDRVQMEMSVAEARLLSAQEDLAVRRLEFRRIEAQLEQRQVRAPIDGVVTEVLKDTGEFVSPSDPVVARVAQLDPLLVVFSVPLAQRQAVTRHQRVALQLGSASQTAEGIVEYVSPTADASNTSVRVKVRLANPDGQWQAGEHATLMLNAAPAASQPAPSPLAARDR